MPHNPAPKDTCLGPEHPPLPPQSALTCPVAAVWAQESCTQPAGQGHKVRGDGRGLMGVPATGPTLGMKGAKPSLPYPQPQIYPTGVGTEGQPPVPRRSQPPLPPRPGPAPHQGAQASHSLFLGHHAQRSQTPVPQPPHFGLSPHNITACFSLQPCVPSATTGRDTADSLPGTQLR